MATDQKDLIYWFEHLFWPTYPNDLCEGRKGPKAEALKEMLKLNPDEAERSRILENLRAHIIADRKIKQRKWIERWPHARRYIKHRWWDNEIPSVVDSLLSTSDDVASVPKRETCDKCEKPVRWKNGKVKLCLQHYDECIAPTLQKK